MFNLLNKVANRFTFKRMCQKPKKQNGFIISMSLAFAIGFVTGFLGIELGTIGTAIAIGVSVLGAMAIYGGIAVSSSSKVKQTPIKSSATYGQNVLQTQTDNRLPVAMAYGRVKLAGNKLYQNDGQEHTVKKLISFGAGEISAFTSIKINDEPYCSIETSLTGDDNDLVFMPSSSKENFYVEYLNPNTANAVLSASYNSGNGKITINLATDADSKITTTANDIKNIINNNISLSAIATVENKADNNGNGIVTAMGALKASIKISGCKIRRYTGIDSQLIDSMIEGATNTEKAEKVGGLKNIAYLGVEAPKSSKIDVNFNLTTIVEGRKVRVYTSETTYETKFSDNPVWCLLDFLTDYNGAGLGLNEDGTRNDSIIRKNIDIPSFIEAAAFCEDVIEYYELSTSLAGTNNDLIFKARAAGDTGIKIEYKTPSVAYAEASVSVFNNKITVNLATNEIGAIVTTANDVISLINNSSDALALVRVYNLEGNNGTGVVTEMPETPLASGGDGVPRFSFNMVFDSDFSIRDAIEEFKLNCRGALVTKGEKLQFKVDKPEDVCAIFTQDDIIKGSEQYYTIPIEEHYDILDVEFIDSSNEWAKVQAQAELEDYKNTPAIKHSITAYSVTKFEQAARLAWYYLNSKILCPDFGSFSTGFKAFAREIGDVIQITDTLMGFKDKKVKITKIIDDNTGIYEVSWRSYNEAVYSDELGCQEPVLIKTNINNPYAVPADLTSFDATIGVGFLNFAWDGDGYNFVEIREGESWDTGAVIASGLNGNSASIPTPNKENLQFFAKRITKYLVPSANALQKNISLPVPDAPTDIVLNETGWQDSDGTHFGYINIDFTPSASSDVINYIAYLSEDNGATWKEKGTFNGVSYSISGVKTGITYKVGVIAVNKYLIKSEMMISDSITIIGKDELPPDVISFTATPLVTDRTKIKLKWARVDSIPDLRGYEIREGNEWESGTPITSLLYNTEEYIYEITENRDYKFHIRAVDNSYKYSANALYVIYSGSIYPDQVQNFKAYQNGESILLGWDKITAPDVVGVEIRAGRSWDTGDLVVTGLKDNTFSIPVSFEKRYYYTIKAITVAGNASSLSAQAWVDVTNLLPKNVIKTYEELTAQDGTKNNVAFGVSDYNWNNIEGTWNDYPSTSWDQFGGLNVLRLLSNNEVNSLIADGHFEKDIDLVKWSKYTTGTYTLVKNSNGNLLLTFTANQTSGATYLLPRVLDRATTYVVEYKFKSSKAGLSNGFIGATSGYTAGACTPSSLSLNNVAGEWKTVKQEFTTSSSGVEPTKFLFAYGAMIAGDYIEIEWARIYKKVDESKFIAGVFNSFVTSGDYTTLERDMGQDVTAQITIDYFANTSLDTSDFKAELQYRIKTASGAYSNWETYIKPINKTFRYFQARCLLSTNDASRSPQVSIFEVKIDVPDFFVTKLVESIPVSGANISFGHTFYTIPCVSISATGGKVAKYLPANVTLTGVNGVQVLDLAGADVGGDIVFSVRGY